MQSSFYTLNMFTFRVRKCNANRTPHLLHAQRNGKMVGSVHVHLARDSRTITLENVWTSSMVVSLME